MNNSANTIASMLFIIIGVFVVAGDFLFSLQTWQFVKNSQTANGIVTAQTAGPSHLEVKFTTADGKEIEYSQNGMVSGTVGEKVEIIYDPQNPKDASFNRFWALWGGHLMFLILGIVFIGLGIFKLFYPNNKIIRWNFEE